MPKRLQTATSFSSTDYYLTHMPKRLQTATSFSSTNYYLTHMPKRLQTAKHLSIFKLLNMSVKGKGLVQLTTTSYY